MTQKQKPRNAVSTGAAKKTTYGSDSTRNSDPLIGWFGLARLSRLRQQKRAFGRKHRGGIDALLLAEVALCLAGVWLLVGGSV